MDENEFTDTVRDRGRIESDEAARRTTEATLRTLGERIGDSQAAALAEGLPGDPASALLDASPDEAADFSFEEFLERVAERAEVDEEEALLRARAVADALSAADPGELRDAREQLPREFDLVFETGERMTADELFGAVRDRADLESEEDARSATHAVLRTLAERITAGQAADFATYLPGELDETVTAQETEEPASFPVDEFVARVADRAGVDENEAERRTRAVLGALSEVVSDREFESVRDQLPAAFDDLDA